MPSLDSAQYEYPFSKRIPILDPSIMSMSSPIFVYAIYIFFFFSATPQRYVTHVAQLLITQRSLSKIMKWTYVLGPVSWDFHCCSPKILGHYNKDFIWLGRLEKNIFQGLPVKLSKIVREMLCTQFTHWKAYMLNQETMYIHAWRLIWRVAHNLTNTWPL